MGLPRRGVEGLEVSASVDVGRRLVVPEEVDDVTHGPVEGAGQPHHEVQLGNASAGNELGRVPPQRPGELFASPPPIRFCKLKELSEPRPPRVLGVHQRCSFFHLAASRLIRIYGRLRGTDPPAAFFLPGRGSAAGRRKGHPGGRRARGPSPQDAGAQEVAFLPSPACAPSHPPGKGGGHSSRIKTIPCPPPAVGGLRPRSGRVGPGMGGGH